MAHVAMRRYEDACMSLPEPDAQRPDMPQDTVSFGFEDIPAATKAGRVRAVFDSVAGRYDLMNDLMSLGAHRLWKDAVIDRLHPQPGQFLVDVAGGTGDLARRFVDRARRAGLRRSDGRPARAVVVDINHSMLVAGRNRGTDEAIEWAVGDAQRLPLPDGCADAVTIAFGIRNVTDIPAALVDMRRVLRPGGRFACLEFSRPINATIQRGYDAWAFRAIPRIGAMVTGDEGSYRYLVESIARFPEPARFAAMVVQAGFRRVEVTRFAGGVVALHTGWAL
jgi:demethylmenaquinone methyltransferase/2-methoxy-6-polyprenyl-1,4-benzoquinol methylase